MFVLIIDYGSGNIKSVYNSVSRALHNLNKFSEVKVSRSLSEIEKADKIILPGVGSFDQCMNRIRKIKDLEETLKDQVITKKKPFLGICVGMQILADYGYENKKTKGFSWINGDVKPLKNFLDNSQKLKIPHMGWNKLSIYKNNNLFNDITDNDQSIIKYHFPNADQSLIKKSGHWLHAENPEDFFRVTLDWLKKTSFL